MWENNRFFRSIAVILSISIFLSFGLPIESMAVSVKNDEKEIISEKILSSNMEDVENNTDTKTKAGTFKKKLKDGNDKIENSIKKQNIEETKNYIKDFKNSLKNNKQEIKEEFKTNKEKLKKIKAKEGIKRQEQFEVETEQKLEELENLIDSLDKLSDSLSDVKGSNLEEIKEKVKQIEEIVNPERPDKPLGNNMPNEKIEENNPVILSQSRALQSSNKEPTSADLDQTSETKIEKEVQDINNLTKNWDVIEIYNYVKNKIDYEPYYGSKKGATGTIQELAGNDVDQSSLLISLLRDQKIPARYVAGVVEIPIEKVEKWTKTENGQSAVKILASSGRPVTAVTSEGEIKSVRLEHTWVEAYIPYENYRGIGKNEGQNIWVPLDPSFKEYEKIEGSDLGELSGVSLEDIKNQLKSNTITIEEAGEKVELGAQNLEAYIKDNKLENEDIHKFIGGYKIQTNYADILSQELEHKQLTRIKEYSKVPIDMKDRVILKLEGTDAFGINFENNNSLEHTINADEAYGKKITISWEPSTEEDKNIIESYGGVFSTPSYLVEMKPQLKIDGKLASEGQAVSLGYRQNFKMTFASQGTTSEEIENTLLVGGMYTLGLDYGKISIEELDKINKNMKNVAPELTEENIYTDEGLGEILNAISKGYFSQLELANTILSEAYNVSTSKSLSAAIVGYEPIVKYMFKQPVEISEGSLYIDIDRNVSAVVSKDNNKTDETGYMLTAGIISSGLEHVIFEEILDIESVSAVKILEEAKKQNMQIYTITQGNIEEKIGKIEVNSTVKTDIRNAVNKGRVVLIPEKNMKINDWEGTGYIVLDKETGSAAYMISGGLSGGSTTKTVKAALIVNLAMIIIDIIQAVALLSTGPIGVVLGIIFIGSGIHQTISQIDYYKSGNDDQIIKDAVIGVATTGGLSALKRLAKHLKLLKGACFKGETKVLTEEGYKEIKEVKEGEKVESFNEDTGEKKLKKVTGVEITEAQKLIHIKTERAEIKVTPSHPMLKVGNTWVFAGALRVGDKLVGYDGNEVEVTEIESVVLESPQKVYNLTIEDFHTYVVSEESVVVHNKCDLPGLKGTSDVWTTIKATQPAYRGTVIPRSFEITLGNGKMWVHGNGTKHIYEEVAKQMKSPGINPKYYSQLLMDDFSGALSKATKNGVKYDELISVGNWEFKFSIPREEGLLPVIKHAQFNGWGN